MYQSLLASSMWEGVTNYFANFDGATNACRTVFLWLAIALTVAFIACKIAVKKELQGKINLISLICAIVYALACIITFAVCSFVEDEIVAITFYPLLVFAICCIVGGLLVSVKPLKAVKIAVASAVGAAFIAVIVCMIVYYASGNAEEWNYITLSAGENVGLYLSALALVAVIVALAFFSDRNSKPFDARTISFAAVCIALSFALSYIRFFKMPMGGSITFASMLPVMLFSYMFGSRKGVLAGLILGALQAIQDPWILHPAQFLLDYGVAFAAIGVTGCVKGFKLFDGKPRLQFTLGAVIGGMLRFISHFFSGAFAFGSYGAYYADEFGIPALSNPYVYSLLYQTMYVIPEIIIVVVVGLILFSSKSFVKAMNSATERGKSKPKSSTSPAAEDEEVQEKA